MVSSGHQAVPKSFSYNGPYVLLFSIIKMFSIEENYKAKLSCLSHPVLKSYHQISLKKITGCRIREPTVLKVEKCLIC